MTSDKLPPGTYDAIVESVRVISLDEAKALLIAFRLAYPKLYEAYENVAILRQCIKVPELTLPSTVENPVSIFRRYCRRCGFALRGRKCKSCKTYN